MEQQTILRWPAVKDRIGLCRSRVYQLIEAGKFPKQIKISERATGWLESEINQWIEERIKAREAINGF